MAPSSGNAGTNGNDHHDPSVVSRTIEYTRPTRESALIPPGGDMSMSMGIASSPSSAHPSKAARSPLDAPWDVASLPQPGRSAPTPPVAPSRYQGIQQQTNGGLYPASSGRRESIGGYVSSNSPSRSGSIGGQGTGSANASPNPNRYSAAHGTATAAMYGLTAGMGASNGHASTPPPRPSRAGTVPLDGLYPLVTNGLQPSSATGATMIASPLSNAPPSFNRAPASMSNIHHQPLSAHQYQSMAMGDQALTFSPNTFSSNAGTLSSALSPPPLLHQPFSAPGNPYAVANGSETTVAASIPVRNSGGSDEKDLPEKPKGRERSLTNKSNKDGKKSVFGFMSGESLGRGYDSRAWLSLPLGYADLLSKDKQPVISGPYDPVHLTHVGFNSDTGECKSSVLFVVRGSSSILCLHSYWLAARMARHATS